MKRKSLFLKDKYLHQCTSREMDRATRKANLKKLQLPGTAGSSQRKTRHDSKTKGTPAISNYFLTPEKNNKNPIGEEDIEEKIDAPSNICSENSADKRAAKTKNTRAKKPKLDDFVFKKPIDTDGEPHVPNCVVNDDDFDVPEKVKKAPPTTVKSENSKLKNTKKSSRKKKQTTIKSAFLRNEQLFAEIAAQHCAADNFDGDDVQLAIVISRSEAESKGIVQYDCEDNAIADINEGEKNAEVIRQKLEKYGFRTAEKEDYSAFTTAFMTKNNRTKKSKWANKFTALTLRAEETQNKKLQEKINLILHKHWPVSDFVVEGHKDYQLQSKLLQICYKNSKTKVLHLPENPELAHERYFVEELFKVNNLPPGHLLKNWAAIQGRDLTPKKRGPYEKGLAAKMRKIYNDLENYFESMKKALETDSSTSSFRIAVSGETTQSGFNKAVVISSTQDIEAKLTAEKYFKSLTNSKEIESAWKPENKAMKSLHMEEQPPITPALFDVINVSQSAISTDKVTIENIYENGDTTENLAKFSLESKESRALKHLNHEDAYETIVLSGSTTNSEENNESESYKHRNISDCEQILKETLTPIGISNVITNTLTADTLIRCDTNFTIKTPSSSKNYVTTKMASGTPSMTESTINSSQKPRSNSPDLFADSDVEMQELYEGTEDNTDNNNISVEEGNITKHVTAITTYELYSSDEVKTSLALKPPDLINISKDLKSPQNQEIERFTHLPQNEEDNKNMHAKSLNRSKLLNEVDIFAESPLSEDDLNGEIDINSNSQTSKYIKNKMEKSLKFPVNIDGIMDSNCENDSLKFTLSMEVEDIKLNKSPSSYVISQNNGNREKNNSRRLSLDIEIENCSHSDSNSDLVFTGVEDNTNSYSFKFPFQNGEDKNLSGKQNGELSLSMETIRRCETNDNMDVHEISLQQHKTARFFLCAKEDNEKQEDSFFHEIEINQTNTSFLNFEGPQQLKSDFHKETAKEKIPDDDGNSKQHLAGNDTLLKELYNKYLGVSKRKNLKSNETNLRKSISQIIPKYETTKRSNDFTFNMDLASCDHYKDNRKSLSFHNTSPEKNNLSLKAGLSKSQSFTSLDLTQIENVYPVGATTTEDEDNDDCLVLSDDEINYSIWKANKTEKFKGLVNDGEDSENEDVICVGGLNGENGINTFKPINREQLNINNSVSQTSYSDFDVKSPKTQNLLRSNFGILEEFSEPMESTPNNSTPTNILDNASFIQTPSAITAQLMKRYSIAKRSSQKFNNLLNDIDSINDDIPQNNYDDYDEFDRMVLENEITKVSSSRHGLPQGFEQLMTAEISLKESQDVSSNSQSSPIDNLQQINSVSSKPIDVVPISGNHQEITINNKSYTIRHIEEPKPNYALYTEAELLKELYNYGIKPLKRKQAVKMLEYIYLQTHPIIVDDQPLVEIEKDGNRIILPSSSKSYVNSKPVNCKNDNSTDIISSFSSPATIHSDVHSLPTGCELNLRDGSGSDMVRYSSDLKAELYDEQYILQTNVTKKTQQPLMPFHIAWYNLVCCNPKLHESILMYEPIDLQEIYLFLKGIGYRYDPKDLKQFFDRRCIIFRYDLANGGANNKEKNRNRHVRKNKKTDNKRPAHSVNMF